MKRSFLLFLFIISILLYSCTESTGSGTLKITIQQISGKSLTPQTSASRIVKYNVSGSGPGGRTFSKDSSSKTISIEGLANGTWTITASGLTSSGQKILSGEKVVKFTGSYASETINLDTDVGSGTLSLTFKWDSTITSPSAKIYLDGVSLDFSASYSVEIPAGESSYTFTRKNLNSGMYTVRVLLFNAGNSAGGFCEAVSIVNTVTTSGTVSLKSGDTITDSESRISVSTSDGYTISGVLSDIDSNLTIGMDYSVSLDLTSSYYTEDTLYITWYEDGIVTVPQKAISHNGASMIFTAKKGSHLINAVVASKESGSCSSASIRYIGYTDDAQGSAVESGTVAVTNSQNIRLDSSTLIGLLPDNKILVLSPESGTLQLCHVANDTLILETNGTYSFSQPDFSWLHQSNLLVANPNFCLFGIADSYKNISILKYNAKTGGIEYAKRVSDDTMVRYEGYYSDLMPDLSNISSGCIISTGENQAVMLFSDNDQEGIISLGSSDLGVESENIILKKTGYENAVLLTGSKGHIVSCSGKELGQITFSGKWATSFWKYTEQSYISNPKKILLYNDTNLLIMDEKYIERVGLTSSLSGYNNNGKITISATDMTLSPDGQYFYTITESGKLYSFATDYVGYFKQLNVLDVGQTVKQVVANNSTVIVVGTDGTLHLYDVSEGEI